jgi:diaminohydroxyphosphoribosylaminopyrimidine deaminase/5-amino-6-(5-phosphoribosylamino)uracil reductase
LNADTDRYYLSEALLLAKVQQGFCAPNPSVGALIVRDAKIIGCGYHLGVGLAHAEVAALASVPDAINATVYVTLEPCCHWGRTPPCTDALIKAGIKRVVYGYRDPNPLVSGKGEIALQAAGIACEYISHSDIDDFYKSYSYWQATKLPFVTAKIALSLDGRIAGAAGEPLQITGEALKKFTHDCRKTNDAILTTINTIIYDNPQLNVRYPDKVYAKPLYILDSQLAFPLTATVLTTAKSITLFHSTKASLERQQQLIAQGIRCVSLGEDKEGLILAQAIKLIGQDGHHSLWVEAGGKCFSALVREQLLQRAFIYIAPKWFGTGKIAFPADFSLDISSHQLYWQQFGNDVLCEVCW